MMRAVAIIAMLATVMLSEAHAADLHRLWDEQCGGCHGHAGAFARASLHVVDDRLVGRLRGDRVVSYLERHNGGYPADIIDGMVSMLRAQLQTPDSFAENCSECHGTAAQFARETLVSRDGALYGRYSQRLVADYLTRHGRLDANGAARMVEVLTRVEREVHGVTP